MRLFVAADLPSELGRRLADLQDGLRDVPLPVRWVDAGGIHLTLKFLGEVAPARLDEIKTAVGGAGRRIRPFRLEPEKPVPFPARGAPRLIWVELRGDLDAARALAAAVDAATARIGFPLETREFKPHLTLGRVKGPARGDWREVLERKAGGALQGFDVTEYVLFESRLGPRGATYTAIERFPLASEAAAGGTT